MPRKRTTNKHLHSRVYWKNGSYRMLTKDGKWIKLGKTLSEMYKTLSELHFKQENVYTFSQLIDRYLTEVAPTKSEKSYINNLQQSKKLKLFFLIKCGRVKLPL